MTPPSPTAVRVLRGWGWEKLGVWGPRAGSHRTAARVQATTPKPSCPPAPPPPPPHTHNRPSTPTPAVSLFGIVARKQDPRFFESGNKLVTFGLGVTMSKRDREAGESEW